MSYITTINQRTYTVTVGENGEKNTITLDGTAHTIDWRRIATLATDARNTGGRYSLVIAGKSYDILVHRTTKPAEKDSQTYEIFVAGQRFEVKVEDERTRTLTSLARGNPHAGEVSVQAPMPGLVVGVPVEVGATVNEGQTVIVLEAMKMENDLPAPITGKVKEIPVSSGQTVEQGQVLAVIEGEP
ncbi:MAG TPA: acetyl-CoA carboxylase biotin carboxyl carrier protein subunit [Ktedonobacteraceae bacterium]|jgi:biotin carboxyl carrier protein